MLLYAKLTSTYPTTAQSTQKSGSCSTLSSPLRNERKFARLRRSGKLAEFKRELVDEVFQSCCAIANLNCNLDQPTQLSNDGAALVGKQLLSGCSWVHTLWLETK